MSNPKDSATTAPSASDRSVSARLAVVCLFLLPGLGLVAGCKPGGESEPELETVDVVAPTIEVTIEDDPRAAPRKPELVGVLPDDFPTALPIYLPSSLVDFGAAEDGWLSVSLLSSDSRPRVEAELRSRLIARGWQLRELTGGALGLRRGEERGRLRVEGGNPGTLYHYEYPGPVSSRAP